jgi:hypothetical protein
MPSFSWKAHCAVSLFRTWAAARTAGQPVLPLCIARAQKLKISDQAGVSCASLFQLLEARLQRPLVPECCCSQNYSPDEQIIVSLLYIQTHEAIKTPDSQAMNALKPAAYAAAISLGLDIDDQPYVKTPNEHAQAYAIR